MLLVFVLMGALAGYVSACMYKSFNGAEWRQATLKTAVMSRPTRAVPSPRHRAPLFGVLRTLRAVCVFHR